MHRHDIWAQQTRSGQYILRREPVTERLIVAHLRGRVTCGWYALDSDSTCRWAAVDADSRTGLQDLQRLWAFLKAREVPSYIEGSRRGGHLWVFFEPLAARPVRRLMGALVEMAEVGPVELFPKQDRLTSPERVGSLMRGPLGVHQEAGRAFGFLEPETLRLVGLDSLSQLDYICSFERLPAARVAELLADLMDELRRKGRDLGRELVERPPPTSPPNGGLIAEIKSRIGDIYDFIGQYVPLDERGRGPCPFHPPDRHPSFAVNREGGYWVDFHEVNSRTGRYVGGDAIEFYRRLRGLDHRGAVRELAERLGMRPARPPGSGALRSPASGGSPTRRSSGLASPSARQTAADSG